MKKLARKTTNEVAIPNSFVEKISESDGTSFTRTPKKTTREIGITIKPIITTIRVFKGFL
ncbi:hypothetical protein HYX00_03940 [Candidatus Woesearchaeota archaeon]|nr:hypothetical protein [Candidatus Woesearchaeota archaeon]